MADEPPRVRRRGSGLHARLRRVARVVLLFLVVLVFAPVVPALADDTDAATYTGTEPPLDVCSEAKRLNEEGRPRDALALIARHRAVDPAATTASPAPVHLAPRNRCHAERDQALTRIARGQAYATLASDMNGAGTATESAPTEQGTGAVLGEAQSLDQTTATDDTSVVTSPASSVQACPVLTSGLQVTAQQAQRYAEQCDITLRPTLPPAGKTLPVQLKNAWDTANKEIVGPLTAAALPIVLLTLSLLVVARLVIPFIRDWPPLDRSKSGRLTLGSAAVLLVGATCTVLSLMAAPPGSVAVTMLLVSIPLLLGSGTWLFGAVRRFGAMAVVVAAITSGLAVIGALNIDVARPVLFAVGVILAVLGVSLAALEMATRLRLSISVIGSDGQEAQGAVAHLIALLEEMGGDGPMGLEVPQGADTTALTTSVIAKDPTNAVLKVLWSAWQLLIAPAPWRIQVAESARGRLDAVITRNGRPESAIVADPAVLVPAVGKTDSETGDPVRQPDMYRFVGAAVLVAMARRHRGFEGLYGVTDWRSLGYHCIATLDLEDGQLRRQLLSCALQNQDDNLPAQLALIRALHREDTNEASLTRLAAWLDKFVKRLRSRPAPCDGSVSPLELRARNMAVAVLVNRDHAKRAHAPSKDLEDAVLEFSTALGKFTTSPDTETFYCQMLARLAWFQAEIDDEASTPVDVGAPENAYSAACYYGSHYGSRPERYDKLNAIRHLTLADVDPENKVWRTDDPQLWRLRGEPEYRKDFGRQPRNEVTVLAPIGAIAAPLKSQGLTTAESICAYKDSTHHLARLLGVRAEEAARAVETAVMVNSLPEPLQAYAVEIAHALLEKGLIDPARLRTEARAHPDALVKDLTNTLSARVDVADNLSDLLTAWVSTVGSPVTGSRA